MIWLVGSLVYAVVGLVVARLVAGHQAWHLSDSYHQTKPDGSDWFCAGLLGLGAGVVWPVCSLLALVLRFTPKVGAEARAVARQRDRRIQDLERELGIR